MVGIYSDCSTREMNEMNALSFCLTRYRVTPLRGSPTKENLLGDNLSTSSYRPNEFPVIESQRPQSWRARVSLRAGDHKAGVLVA